VLLEAKLIYTYDSYTWAGSPVHEFVFVMNGNRYILRHSICVLKTLSAEERRTLERDLERFIEIQA
jgi:hypothetical protein